MYEATSGAAFSKLESAAFAGGRITASEGTNGAIYTAMNYVTDHLGSTRVVVNASNGDVSSRNDYYASVLAGVVAIKHSPTTATSTTAKSRNPSPMSTTSTTAPECTTPS